MLQHLRDLDTKFRNKYGDDYVTVYKIPLKDGTFRKVALERHDNNPDPLLQSLRNIHDIQYEGAESYRVLQALIEVIQEEQSPVRAMRGFLATLKSAHQHLWNILYVHSHSVEERYNLYRQEFRALEQKFLAKYFESTPLYTLPSVTTITSMTSEQEQKIFEWLEDILEYHIEYYRILKLDTRTFEFDCSRHPNSARPQDAADLGRFIDYAFENVLIDPGVEVVELSRVQITPAVIRFFEEHAATIKNLVLNYCKFDLDPAAADNALMTRFFDALLRLENLEGLYLSGGYSRNFCVNFVFPRLVQGTPLKHLQTLSILQSDLYVENFASAIRENCSIRYLDLQNFRLHGENEVEKLLELEMFKQALRSSEVEKINLSVSFSPSYKRQLEAEIALRMGAVKGSSSRGGDGGESAPKKQKHAECHLCGVKVHIYKKQNL